ncbi:tRNA pseudouridine(13) synthase TruD [Candidatus Pacearchaeota archaeon]|nr:tRNA pseudouridine(13) synthase TruD [Candidatus Pacearchaeota archaeon]
MKIKQIPEDFIVNEVIQLKKEPGKYFYYKLKKKNWNTLDIIKEISSRLKTKDIGFAGIKDRNALTTQYISTTKKIDFKIKDVEFEYQGTGKERIYIGALEGNEFIITIRDLDKQLKAPKEMVNYFGEQRFSEKNALVGKLLIQKKFKEACSELNLDVENNDYVKSLRSLGLKELRFYIHAYQSLLWNKLAEKSKKKLVPIIGFLTEGKDYDNILKNEGITKKDFIVRSIPEISSEGAERQRVIPIKNFKTLEFTDDELNESKKKQIVSFMISKGSYATIVIKNLKN